MVPKRKSTMRMIPVSSEMHALVVARYSADQRYGIYHLTLGKSWKESSYHYCQMLIVAVLSFFIH